jgi:hypothetical protein
METLETLLQVIDAVILNRVRNGNTSGNTTESNGNTVR